MISIILSKNKKIVTVSLQDKIKLIHPNESSYIYHLENQDKNTFIQLEYDVERLKQVCKN